MNAFTDEDMTFVRQQVALGRPFIKIARELEDRVLFLRNKRVEPVECLNALIALGNYIPEVYPVWEHFDYLQTSDQKIRIVMHNRVPHIAVLEGVLTEEECDEVIRRATPQLTPSLTQSIERAEKETHRTSETAYLTRGQDEFITRLDRRCSEVMGQPIGYGESLQVVRYPTGGQYGAHYDYFAQDQVGNGGNRTATLLIYLNDVAEGGETYFPGLGLSIRPKKGSAVYFQYSNSDGQFDPQTLHGGAPVLHGEKWIVTKWMRQGTHIPPL